MTGSSTNSPSTTNHQEQHAAETDQGMTIAARRGYTVNENVLERWEAKQRSAQGGGEFVWRINAPKREGEREEVRMKALQLAALNAYKASSASRPRNARTQRVERRS